MRACRKEMSREALPEKVELELELTGYMDNYLGKVVLRKQCSRERE